MLKIASTNISDAIVRKCPTSSQPRLSRMDILFKSIAGTQSGAQVILQIATAVQTARHSGSPLAFLYCSYPLTPPDLLAEQVRPRP